MLKLSNVLRKKNLKINCIKFNVLKSNIFQIQISQTYKQKSLR